MTKNGIRMALAFAAMSALSAQAFAGPNCNTGGARYSAPRPVAAKPAPAAPRVALASQTAKPAPIKAAPAAVQGGGDVDAAPRKANVEAPVVQKQAEAPRSAPENGSDYTSISGVTARLAALAAQQAAAARTSPISAE